MKKLLFYLLILLVLSACEAPGISHLKINGTEKSLPPELKGFRIYKISDGDGNYLNVIVPPTNVITNGKNCLLTSDMNLIEISEIISMNDSIVVAKLKKPKNKYIK